MKEIAVIGLNNYGMEIARELTLGGSSVTAIDKDKLKIDQIAREVADTVLIHKWDIAKLKSVDFDRYDVVILVMSENMDLVLSSMIYLQLMETENIVICTENDNQAMVADLFRVNQGWKALRFDKQVAENVKSLIADFNT